MLQQLLLSLYIIALLSEHSICATCIVERVAMRVPREHDIGLIFDLTVANRKTDQSEMLGLTVNSNGACTLNLTNGEQVQAGTVYGGNFGLIAPGNSVTVALVLPTESVFNRVGSCPIVISSVSPQNVVNKTNQILHFDTRFEALDPGNQTLRSRRDFIDCKNWDKNYLSDCAPLDCEERYFGQRSFYNRATEHCEPFPPSFGEGMQINYYSNECLEMKSYVTEANMRQERQRNFANKILDPYGTGQNQHNQPPKTIENSPPKKDSETNPSQAEKECNAKKVLSLVEFNNCFQQLQDAKMGRTMKKTKLKKKSLHTSKWRNFYYDWYMPLKTKRALQEDESNKNINIDASSDENENATSVPDNRESTDNPTVEYNNTNVKASSASNTMLHNLSAYSPTEWLIMFIEMLLIISLVIIFQIIVTLFTYAVISITLYGFLEILAELKPYKVTGSHLSKKLTPRHRNVKHDIMTSASLMSQLK